MKKSSLALTIALLPLFAFAADISGTWTASFDTQIGVQSYTFVFKVDGAALTGTAKSANGEYPIEEGKVDGNAVSFVENMMYQGMPLKMTYTGNVVSDNEIQFTRDVAGIAKEELVAKRSQ
ncbi:MAG TPA: hypothetical protein VIC71_10690 [Gammaproteobacteria bacterium]|jgi:hypothetical protein